MASKRGGKRPGAGRKPDPDGQSRIVPRAIRVSAEVDEYLADRGTGIVEDTLRRTKDFRAWLKNKN